MVYVQDSVGYHVDDLSGDQEKRQSSSNCHREYDQQVDTICERVDNSVVHRSGDGEKGVRGEFQARRQQFYGQASGKGGCDGF